MMPASESVTIGHPDRLADLISENLLTHFLRAEPFARVHIQTSLFDKDIHVWCKLSGDFPFDATAAVYQVLVDCGYAAEGYRVGFTQLKFGEAFVDFQKNLKPGQRLPTSDQGVVTGFASNQNTAYLPMEHCLAKALTDRLQRCRDEKIIPYLKPDGKSLVILQSEDTTMLVLKHISIASQVSADIPQQQLFADFIKHVLDPVAFKFQFHKIKEVYCDGFLRGGPDVSVGFSGKKIVVDHYGPNIPVGGGSFAGKCPTRLDRTGAFLARYIAKNIVAAGLAAHCLVNLTYRHGAVEPQAIDLDCFGTEIVPIDAMVNLIKKKIGFSLDETIERFKLRETDYYQVARLGYFGDFDHAWEKTDLSVELKLLVKS